MLKSAPMLLLLTTYEVWTQIRETGTTRYEQGDMANF